MKQKLWLPAKISENRSKNKEKKQWSARTNKVLNAVKNNWRSPGSNRSPHSSEWTALSTQPNSHLRMAAKDCPCSCLVSSNQARLRIRSCNVVWLHPSSSTCALWLVSASQRKKIKSDDHLSMCNCSGATELDKAVKFRISRSAWCTFSRGEQIRGYVPRENEHHGAHFRGWCTNSRANLCAGARLREGDRIRCYTGTCRSKYWILEDRALFTSERNFARRWICAFLQGWISQTSRWNSTSTRSVLRLSHCGE